MYNDVTDSFKWKKEKNMQTALYGKIKEKREVEGEWLIGAKTQNMLMCGKMLYLLIEKKHGHRRRRQFNSYLCKFN